LSSSVEPLCSVVERFIAGAREPALLDPGEEPLSLIPKHWELAEWNGRVILQAWDTRRNLACKITGIKEQRRDRLSLFTERFPKTNGEIQIADLAAPEGHELGRRTSRIAFRERFRFMLAREFPDWRIEDLSSDANLEASLSPSYIRAFIRSGANGMAVLAAPPDCAECAGIVPFGVIWLDYLRRREKKMAVGRLLLFCPMHAERDAVSRAHLIDPAKAECTVYVYDGKDRTGPIDLADAGNIDSTLPPCRRPSIPNTSMPEIPEMAGVDRIEQSDGALSFRVRGLEFARWTAGKLTCGIARKKRCALEDVIAMAREVTRVRCESAADLQHPLYTQCPEGWLESAVRADPETIDASLLPAPIYGQVPIFAARDRGVIDLLGMDSAGQLVIVELKASADLQLPFQALDYWLRVRKHLAAGDFERLGYFAGMTVSQAPPRILLVAPALEFHSTSETMLGYLRREIEVGRIGLASDWRRQLRVMFRLRGCEAPQ
jgi:hypothetical protein